jgi:hypothetical protein
LSNIWCHTSTCQSNRMLPQFQDPDRRNPRKYQSPSHFSCRGQPANLFDCHQMSRLDQTPRTV